MITAIRSYCRYRNEPAPHRHRFNRVVTTVIESVAVAALVLATLTPLVKLMGFL